MVNIKKKEKRESIKLTQIVGSLYKTNPSVRKITSENLECLPVKFFIFEVYYSLCLVNYGKIPEVKF